MAANVRSLIIDLFASPDGTVYAILIATFIVVLTTGLCLKIHSVLPTICSRELFGTTFSAT